MEKAWRHACRRVERSRPAPCHWVHAFGPVSYPHLTCSVRIRATISFPLLLLLLMLLLLPPVADSAALPRPHVALALAAAAMWGPAAPCIRHRYMVEG